MTPTSLDDLEALYALVDPVIATLPDEVRDAVQPFRIAHRKHRHESTLPEPLKEAQRRFPAAKLAFDEYLLANARALVEAATEITTPVASDEVYTSMPPAVPESTVADVSSGAGYLDHPAAAIFPMMDEDDLAKLAADILENGLQEPVVLFEGRVVDGRNRQRACLIAGLTPTYTEWTGTGSVVQWVLSRNLHRRHLTNAQRSIVAGRAKAAFVAEAEERRLANLLQNKDAIDGLDPGHRSGGRSAQQAADELGVSRDAVNKAAAVLEHGDATLVDAVMREEVSLDAASLVARLPVEEQKRLVETGEVRNEAAKIRRVRKSHSAKSVEVAASELERSALSLPAWLEQQPAEEVLEPVGQDDEPTKGKWSEHASFKPLVASIRQIEAQVREVGRLLPNVEATRAVRILTTFVGRGCIGSANVIASALVEEQVGGLLVEEALARLPAEGVHPKVDAVRHAVRRYLFSARPMTETWRLQMLQRIGRLAGDEDDGDDD